MKRCCLCQLVTEVVPGVRDEHGAKQPPCVLLQYRSGAVEAVQ